MKTGLTWLSKCKAVSIKGSDRKAPDREGGDVLLSVAHMYVNFDVINATVD